MGFEDECFRETVDSMIDAPWSRPIRAARDYPRSVGTRAFYPPEFCHPERVGTGASPVQAERSSARTAAPFLPFAEGNFRYPSAKLSSTARL